MADGFNYTSTSCNPRLNDSRQKQKIFLFEAPRTNMYKLDITSENSITFEIRSQNCSGPVIACQSNNANIIEFQANAGERYILAIEGDVGSNFEMRITGNTTLAPTLAPTINTPTTPPTTTSPPEGLSESMRNMIIVVSIVGGVALIAMLIGVCCCCGCCGCCGCQMIRS